MNLQIYDYLAARLLEMGALDVFLSPLQMKKNRPGTLLTVVCSPEAMESFTHFLLSETTSIGLRWRIDQRLKTETASREVQTPWGPIQCQISSIGAGPANVTPDYEDCRRVALEKNVPLRTVLDEVSARCTQSRA
jgi:uncharacterized protein (DUF111 family)